VVATGVGDTDTGALTCLALLAINYFVFACVKEATRGPSDQAVLSFRPDRITCEGGIFK